MQLKIDSILYHRNGCSGQGFYAVDFREREGRKFVRRLAAVFVDGDDILKETGTIAVINPDDLSDRRRGDNYEAALRTACKAAHDDDSAYKH
jgi:hypothetical protein